MNLDKIKNQLKKNFKKILELEVVQKLINPELKNYDWCTDNSIYNHIVTNLNNDGSLRPLALKLPDGSFPEHEPGAVNGKIKLTSISDIEIKVYVLIVNLCYIAERNDLENKNTFYNSCTEDTDLKNMLDEFIRQFNLVKWDEKNYISAFAEQLATLTNNCNSVIMGMTIWGLCGDKIVLNDIKKLALHDEFTYYAIKALKQLSLDLVNDLWDLAKKVHGWGRIHLIDALVENELNPEIEDWLFVEGYKNRIGNEMLALQCAQYGKLNEKLKKSNIDYPTYSIATDLICGLFESHPEYGLPIYKYNDVLETTENYLKHARLHSLNFNNYIAFNHIKDFFEAKYGNIDTLKMGNEDRISTIIKKVDSIFNYNKWTKEINDALYSLDFKTYRYALNAAKKHGIDFWPGIMHKLEQFPTSSTAWKEAIELADLNKLDQIFDFAVELLTEKPWTNEKKRATQIDLIFKSDITRYKVLQILNEHPDKGEFIVLKGLNSPDKFKKVIAIQILGIWKLNNRSQEIINKLNSLEATDKDAEIRNNVHLLLNIKPLSWSNKLKSEFKNLVLEAPQKILNWETEDSIYNHIKNNLNEDGSISMKAIELPDGSFAFGEPGTMLGRIPRKLNLFFEETDPEDDKFRIEELMFLLDSIAKSNDIYSKSVFYRNITKEFEFKNILDEFLDAFSQSYLTKELHVYEFAMQLATKSKNCNAVKMGITILGLCNFERGLSIIKTIALHDEFTYYYMKYIIRFSNDVVNELWELSKNVHGLGRINLVEALFEWELNPKILDWLFIDGYKNRFDITILTLPIAIKGKLNEKLKAEEIDHSLYESATDIILGLYEYKKNLGYQIENYDDCIETTENYLKHSKNHDFNFNNYIAFFNIKKFFENESWRLKSFKNESTANNILKTVNELLDSKDWTQEIIEGLLSSDINIRLHAQFAIFNFRIDCWPILWQKLQSNPVESNIWSAALEYANKNQLNEIIDFFLEQLTTVSIIEENNQPSNRETIYENNTSSDWLVKTLKNMPINYSEKLVWGALNSKDDSIKLKMIRLLEKSDFWTGSEVLMARLKRIKVLDRNDEIQKQAYYLLKNSKRNLTIRLTHYN